MFFIEALEGLREVSYLSVILRLLGAVILGGVIGLERGMKNRPAGLRTYMLVCVGSCVIMLTNQYIYQVFGVGDPVRMGAQVVSGIGFLGAGTIVVTRRNQIKGPTTAAGLWTAAAAGLALGIGFYEAAIVGALLIIVILTLMHGLDSRIRRRVLQMELYVEVDSKVSIGFVAKEIRKLGAKIEGIQIDRDYTFDGDIRALVLSIRTPKKAKHEELLAQLQEIEGIIYLEEL
jgi:putative Mg2+ transporter-C (MgtC) family protein